MHKPLYQSLELWFRAYHLLDHKNILMVIGVFLILE
jgi:hypothetical protein